MRSSSRLLTVWLGGMLVAAGSGAALAEDDGPEADEEPAFRSAGIDAARLTRAELSAEPQRSLPGYRNELTELSYRWWLTSGRADLGVGLGTLAYVARPTGSLPGLAADAGSRGLAAGTVLTMGLRYRTSERSALFADASGVHGAAFDNGDAVSVKVGLEFKAAQSRWNVSYGGLGLKLAGDARMTLRVRRGGFGLYMRSTF